LTPGDFVTGRLQKVGLWRGCAREAGQGHVRVLRSVPVGSGRDAHFPGVAALRTGFVMRRTAVWLQSVRQALKMSRIVLSRYDSSRYVRNAELKARVSSLIFLYAKFTSRR